MTVKSLAAGIALAAAWGCLPVAADGAGAGVTSVAAVAPGGPAVQLAAFGAPAPHAPAVDVPSPDQLVGLLNGLADPNVPAADKSGLIEGGLGPVEAGVMDRRMRRGVENGKFPLSFTVTGIAPAGPGAATADVTASGPQMEPRTLNIRFVDQNGWKLSRSSLLTLTQMTSGS